MATTYDVLPITPAAHRHRMHYRGLEVRPADLATRDAPRAGRRMFWRGAEFDGALLDAAPVQPPRGPQFWRGVYF